MCNVRYGSAYDCENIVLTHDQIFCAVKFHFSAGEFAENYGIVLLENHFFVFGALTNGYDSAFQRLFFCGIRDYDTGHGYFLGGGREYDYPVG